MEFNLERFWHRVRQHGRDPVEACWVWIGSRRTGGYGQLTVDGACIGAHRLAYEALRAPIPDGLILDHLCELTPCVNPWHLEPVTYSENNRRRYARRASRADVSKQPVTVVPNTDECVGSVFQVEER